MLRIEANNGEYNADSPHVFTQPKLVYRFSDNAVHVSLRVVRSKFAMRFCIRISKTKGHKSNPQPRSTE
jgi:hypothetical protein